jgi:hypothetical protein
MSPIIFNIQISISGFNPINILSNKDEAIGFSKTIRKILE